MLIVYNNTLEQSRWRNTKQQQSLRRVVVFMEVIIERWLEFKVYDWDLDM